MNDHETTVLSSRLHTLADDITPPLDVVGQVRAARSRHQRQRRGRLALVAVATATAAVAVATVAAADLLTATPPRAEVAVPRHTSATAHPTPTTEVAPPPTTPSGPSAPPTTEAGPTSGTAGWELRSFQGVSFAVPSGARAADTVDLRPVTSWYEGPSLTWNGPALGGGEYSHVKVSITETFEGGLTPADGGEWFTVPGAESAYGGIDYWTGTEGLGPTVESYTFWLQVLAGDRQIHVSGTFPAGEAGEQMARDLLASIVIT
ncbi:hypothetical protein FHU33_4513 [Blastococcus colisei]|uniref:Uncharacterized protein n=1 Tax=Blastococcus colisei TaxID=1564162 RepID=A0A543P156_9ACTN|nr:hypothetical protein [Blastococcus colisei]TQN37846.1 hypothetical protein FHU33_4513 [Blastococcus colisei]